MDGTIEIRTIACQGKRKLVRMKHIATVFFVFTTISFVACDQSDVSPLSGDLIGRVGALMDEFGKLIADKSGYEVRLEGTIPELTATTDEDGKFSIVDLPAGTYNLVFSRSGFQTLKVFSYQFNGGNVPTYYEAPLLSQLSTTSIKSFDAFITAENNPDTSKYTVIRIEFEITPVSTPDNPRTVITYIGDNSNVSSTDYLYQLNDPGFYKFDKLRGGTKLYAVAYPAPVACNAYYDPEKALFINSCLGQPVVPLEIVVIE
jgi:hypothetical protein